MNIRTGLAVSSAVVLSLSASWVLAQEGEAGTEGSSELEVTLSLLPEGVELPDAAIRSLDLPRFPAEEGSEEPGEYKPAQQAQDHALDALANATEARDEGRARGEAAAAAAQDNREEFGRGERPNLEDLLPDQVPEDPGPPDMPGPPDTPPGAP